MRAQCALVLLLTRDDYLQRTEAAQWALQYVRAPDQRELLRNTEAWAPFCYKHVIFNGSAQVEWLVMPLKDAAPRRARDANEGAHALYIVCACGSMQKWSHGKKHVLEKLKGPQQVLFVHRRAWPFLTHSSRLWPNVGKSAAGKPVRRIQGFFSRAHVLNHSLQIRVLSQPYIGYSFTCDVLPFSSFTLGIEFRCHAPVAQVRISKPPDVLGRPVLTHAWAFPLPDAELLVFAMTQVDLTVYEGNMPLGLISLCGRPNGKRSQGKDPFDDGSDEGDEDDTQDDSRHRRGSKHARQAGWEGPSYSTGVSTGATSLGGAGGTALAQARFVGNMFVFHIPRSH